MENNQQSKINTISSIGPQPQSSLERIERLEKWSNDVVGWAGKMEEALNGLLANLNTLHGGAQRGFENIGGQIQNLSTAIQGLNLAIRGTMDFAQATAIVVGKELSSDIEGKARSEVAKIAESDKVKKESSLLDSGLWTEAEEVGKESLVVLSEKDSAGAVVMPRDHLLLGSVQDEIRDRFVGAKIGDSRVIPSDKGQEFNYEILRILNPVEQKTLSSEA